MECDLCYLPATLGHLLIFGELIKVNADHGFAEVFRDFSENLGIIEVGNSLHYTQIWSASQIPCFLSPSIDLPIARARFAGSPDLKMPEPTNTPSQPNC